MQRSTLKSIFGFNVPYRVALEKSGLPTLRERRDALVLNFALAAEKNPKYEHWFPKQPEYKHDVREKKKYKEEFALHDRMKRSPIFSMRKILNDHYLAGG